jgi:hypothetical protein
MERNGVPVDGTVFSEMRRHWDRLKSRLVVGVNKSCNVFVPADHPLDRSARFGVAVREVAGEHGVDHYLLADAVIEQHRIETEALGEQAEAILAARRATGLTVKRIDRLTDSGKDHLDVRGLDVQARQLSGEWPDLGVGIGYDGEGGGRGLRPTVVGSALSTRPGGAGETRPQPHSSGRRAHRDWRPLPGQPADAFLVGVVCGLRQAQRDPLA